MGLCIGAFLFIFYSCGNEWMVILCVFCRRPGREESWTPTVCGLAKRDLLKDILSIFGTFIDVHSLLVELMSIVARSKTLTKLAQDWQETLRRAAAEDL